MRAKLPRILRTASFRLASLYLVVFVASVALLGTVVFWTTRSALERQLRDRIEAEVTYLVSQYQRGGLAHVVTLVDQRDRGISALDYQLRDRHGAVLAGELPRMLPRSLGWNRVQIGEADERGMEPELLLVTTLADGVTLTVGDDLGRVVQAGRAIGRVFASAVGGILLLGIAGGLVISRALLHRVDAMSRTAEAIIAGDLHERVPIRGTRDDLDRLAGTLNRMLDRIELLLRSLRQLSSNVAHDLRTPLSQLRQTLTDAHGHAATVPELRAAMAVALARAEAMQQIFTALLRIAELEGKSRAAPFAPLDLADIMETVADAYQPVADQDGYALTVRRQPAGRVRGDRDLLTQLLANLVENALQHTPPGTRIAIGLGASGAGGAALLVEDDGPGVAPADRARILERFYRCEASRTTPGHGLGLSLVAAIAERHEARLCVEDAGPGLRIRVLFPPLPTAMALAEAA